MEMVWFGASLVGGHVSVLFSTRSVDLAGSLDMLESSNLKQR